MAGPSFVRLAVAATSGEISLVGSFMVNFARGSVRSFSGDAIAFREVRDGGELKSR
jgi:hypothetical protein